MTTPNLTRRGLLGAGAAGAALLAGADAPSASARPRRVRRVDVVVVGAGFAGLSAARAIARAHRSVVVLEARDRVGGRVLNHSLGGGKVVEAGGQYAGPTQDRILALARAYRVRTYPAYDRGDTVTIFGGVRRLGFSPELGAESRRLTARLDSMSATVPIDAPWRASRAAEWDSQTLQTWLDANAETRDGIALFANYADLWGAEPRDVSLLFALFYIAAAGNRRTPGKLDRLLQTRGGAQELRFVGGSQLIAQRIARALGNRVVLSAPVRAITRRRGGVRVHADGVAVDAQRVVVAVPPPLAAAISYEPELPALRAQLLQRLPMGWLAKAEAVYDRPFWRAAGLSGQSVADVGPVDSTFDNTLPGGRPAVLFGFVGGHHARVWSPRSAALRRQQVLRNFATVLADDRALHPRDYFELNWAREEWSRGGPVAYAPPGVLLDYGHVLRRPVGPIHWAGTETSTFWNGYMDGAVRSGERAAREALHLLRA